MESGSNGDHACQHTVLNLIACRKQLDERLPLGL